MTAMSLSPVVWAVLGASVAMLLTMTAGAWAWASSAGVRRGVTSMARARPAFGAALVASAIMVPPAILASLVVCCAGVMLLASSAMSGALSQPQMPPRQVQAPPPGRAGEGIKGQAWNRRESTSPTWHPRGIFLKRMPLCWRRQRRLGTGRCFWWPLRSLRLKMTRPGMRRSSTALCGKRWASAQGMG